MKHATFNSLVIKRFDNCEQVLCRKDKEYSSDTDRLHNFKKAGRIKNQDPVQALDGMWLKHRVSLDDIVENLIKDPLYLPSRELIDEKFGDNIAYTLLLEGLIEDRREAALKQDSGGNGREGEMVVRTDTTTNRVLFASTHNI